MARRRRRNPRTFFHEHPWMTFFLGMGVLETVRVAVRGWEPPWEPAKPAAPALPPANLPALPSAPTTTTAGILGLPSIRGLYR